jgi:hypothetical protein
VRDLANFDELCVAKGNKFIVPRRGDYIDLLQLRSRRA